MNPTRQREQRLSELHRQRESLEDRAASFEAAADMLENSLPDHQRYKPDWLQIANRIRNDARQMRDGAIVCNSEIERVRQHVTAAARYEQRQGAVGQ